LWLGPPHVPGRAVTWAADCIGGRVTCLRDHWQLNKIAVWALYLYRFVVRPDIGRSDSKSPSLSSALGQGHYCFLSYIMNSSFSTS
jgi:hypothetical protein